MPRFAHAEPSDMREFLINSGRADRSLSRM
jgi:hypothetical protein